MRGDSFRLARFAADNDATDIVFCGVHFMAESADILTGDHQRVVLPDLNAGCSMADMADLDQVEEAWEAIAAITDIERVVPITYMNSSAASKRSWASTAEPSARRRTPGRCSSGRSPGATRSCSSRTSTSGATPGTPWATTSPTMRVWNPRADVGGLDEREVKDATFLLWRGWCSVHQRFTPQHVADFRAAHPDGTVIVHPECSHEVVALADQVGSTERILEWTDAAPAGAVIGVGTEIHMVQRLAHDHPDKTVVSLDPLVCPCSTMFRIDAPHLAWCVESLARGEIVNRITVDDRTSEQARVALQRMLDIT